MLSTLRIRYVAERERAGRLGPSAAREVHYVLGAFVRITGDRPANRLTRRQIDTWIQHKDRAPATLRSQLSNIRGFCQWLVEEGYLRKDPTVGIARVRQPRRLPRGLTPEGVDAVLEHCPDPRARLIVSLMVQEGLRCCEVAALQRGDLDTVDWSIRVVGKGGHERVLPITTETREALLAYLGDRRDTAGPLVRSFSHPTKGVSENYISDLVSEWMHEAGLTESAHALRHTAASDVLRAGAHLRDVQAMLGHSSLSTTERYLPLLVGDLRDAMDGRRYRGSSREKGGER